MTFKEQIENFQIEKNDMIRAEVIKETIKGALLAINENLVAFAYTSLPIGAQVWATVKRVDVENEYITLSIDSVLNC